MKLIIIVAFLLLSTSCIYSAQESSLKRSSKSMTLNSDNEELATRLREMDKIIVKRTSASNGERPKNNFFSVYNKQPEKGKA